MLRRMSWAVSSQCGDVTDFSNWLLVVIANEVQTYNLTPEMCNVRVMLSPVIPIRDTSRVTWVVNSQMIHL